MDKEQEHTDHDLTTEFSVECWASEWEKDHGKGFHLDQLNGMLQKYLKRMMTTKQKLKFLFPFCGKDICMKWLVDQGHTVVGCDCAPQAFIDFAKEQNIEYTTEEVDKFTVHTSQEGRLKLYNGNYYDLLSNYEGHFDVIWDRGGFNAVNDSEKTKYRDVTTSLMSQDCQYYLINFEMDDPDKSKEYGMLTDDIIKSFFDEQKFKLELRVEYVPADLYNGDLCKGVGDMKEKLTIITLK